jgi:hypothetical protein
MNFLEGNQLVKSNPFHHWSRCLTPPLVLYVWMVQYHRPSSLSDLNSPKRACGSCVRNSCWSSDCASSLCRSILIVKLLFMYSHSFGLEINLAMTSKYD